MIQYLKEVIWPLKVNIMRCVCRMRNSDIIENITKYRNAYQGKRCFVIGMGPSLTITDLEKISGEITFASNGIYKVFSQTNWRPTFYSVCDKQYYKLHGIEDLEEIQELTKLYPWDLTENHHLINTNYFFRLMKFGRKHPLFSNRADVFLYEGSTVTYFMLQLAVYMGFKEIYLLGIDFNYSITVNNKGEISRNSDVKDYFINDSASQNPVLPNLQASLYAYQSANKYAKKNGIKIYNATRGGKLEVFERKNFEELFKSV